MNWAKELNEMKQLEIYWTVKRTMAGLVHSASR